MTREIVDDDGTTWSCAPAYGGLGDGAGAAAAIAQEKAARDGAIVVVCTPTGGAQSVRVELAAGSLADVDDGALRAAIAAARR